MSMLFCGIAVFAQTKVAPVDAPVEPKQEVACVSQVDNSDLINKVEYLEKEIENYRDDLNLWLGMFVAIITIISGALGFAFPLILNTRAEKRLTQQVDKSIERVNSSIKDLETEKSTAMSDLESKRDSLLKEIQDKKEELTKLKAQGEAAISEITKDIKVQGEKAIAEVRAQTGAKVEKAFSEVVASGLLAALKGVNAETESKEVEKNVNSD